MIRERRNEDLDLLCDVLTELRPPASVLGGSRPLEWLRAVDAERSWVFDQAPVHVAPTRNVVGHVQICRPPPEAPWIHDVAAQNDRHGHDVLVIGRLFVRPARHDYGIARYMLKESVKYVVARGSLPVLDPATLALVPTGLPSKLGFEEFRVDNGTATVLARAE